MKLTSSEEKWETVFFFLQDYSELHNAIMALGYILGKNQDRCDVILNHGQRATTTHDFKNQIDELRNLTASQSKGLGT